MAQAVRPAQDLRHRRGRIGTLGQYMPVAIFFPPAGDDALWAQWQEGVERTPALRKALMKGFRRGHFANKPKPDRERAEAVLNGMMVRDPAEDLAA